MLKNRVELKVRYVETDQMGIVHHSNYYHWFEVGRTEFMEEGEVPYPELEQDGLLTPLVESWCKYKEGARYGDTVIIETWIGELKSAKIVFEYRVLRKSDNKILAKGKTIHGFVDPQFHIISMKKTFPKVWEKFEKLL